MVVIYLQHIPDPVPFPRRAKEDYDSHIAVLDSWDEFCASLDKKMVIMAPFCGEIPCEDLVKKNSARY